MTIATDATTDLITAFTARAAALGVDVERVATVADAVSVIARLASEAGTPPVLVAGELRQAAPGFVRALAEAGLDLRAPGQPSEVRHAQFGLSLARLAVAETGSVVLAEPDLADRSIGMMARTNVVLCPVAALVPSLDDTVSVLRATATRPGGGMATLVTGPSRTADIERVLTVGVQGPARVVVVFIDRLD